MKYALVRFAALVLLVATLAGCASVSAPPAKAQLHGLYGGYLYSSGSPFIAYVIDVSTDSNNRITGTGVASDGSVDAIVEVSGHTDVGFAYLSLRDKVGDRILLTTDQEGGIFRGTWKTSFNTQIGTTRFTHEANIDNLSLQSTATQTPGRLADFY